MQLLEEDGANFIGSIDKFGPGQLRASCRVELDLQFAVQTEQIPSRTFGSQNTALKWIARSAEVRGFKGFYLHST
jgi:hypothetical protein